MDIESLLEKRVAVLSVEELAACRDFLNKELAARKARHQREAAVFARLHVKAPRAKRSDAGRSRQAPEARVATPAQQQPRLIIRVAQDVAGLNALDASAVDAELDEDNARDEYDATHNLGAEP